MLRGFDLLLNNAVLISALNSTMLHNMILNTCFKFIQAAVLAPSSKTEKKIRAVLDKLSSGSDRYILSFASFLLKVVWQGCVLSWSGFTYSEVRAGVSDRCIKNAC